MLRADLQGAIVLNIHLLYKKLALIITGAIISAFGITLALCEGFGGATLAVLWQGVSNIFGISIGTSSAAVALIMILFAFIYDRRQIHIGTIIYQIFYSGFIELFSRLLNKSENTYICIILMLCGIILFALGTGMYSAADLGRGSYEAVTFALAEKNNYQVKYVRIALDISVVIIGVLLGGKFGLCTIITVILSGPIIQLSKNQTEKFLL